MDTPVPATHNVEVRYVRFVVARRSAASGKRLGVIRAAWYYDQEGTFSAAQSAEVQAIFSWSTSICRDQTG